MKFSPPAISFLVIICSASALTAFSEPAALCGVESVFPAGACDTARNPALLPFEETPVSIFAAGSYMVYDKSTSTVDASTQNATLNFKMDRDVTRSFSASSGISFKGERSGFGVMFGSARDALYSKNRNTNSQTIVPNDNSYTSVNDEEEITTNRNPALTVGWGILTGPDSSFGINITGGMIEETLERNDGNIYNGIGSSSSRKDRKRYIFGEGSVGFFYRQNGADGGFIFTTGKHGRRTQEYSYSISSSSTSGSDKVTEKYLMTEAPGFLMGAAFPLTSSLKWVVELAWLFPHSYTADTLDYDWDRNALVKNSEETNAKYSFLCRTGLRYEATPRLVLMTGIMGYTYRVDENIDATNTHSKSWVDGVISGAGFDFIISNAVTLGCTANCSYARARFKLNNQSSSLKIRMREITGEVQAGAALRL